MSSLRSARGVLVATLHTIKRYSRVSVSDARQVGNVVNTQNTITLVQITKS